MKVSKQDVHDISVAINCFKYLCTDSEKIFKALLLKAGKEDENISKEVGNPNKVLRKAVNTMKLFLDIIEPRVKTQSVKIDDIK